MRDRHALMFRCPRCKGALTAVGASDLRCGGCAAVYPVVRGIARFAERDNYTSTFGLQWTRHARTQLDSHSGLRMSEQRFFEETGWGRDLRGERILEVGCGSGRFTEQAARTGADVIAIDYSDAVEANYEANGH